MTTRTLQFALCCVAFSTTVAALVDLQVRERPPLAKVQFIQRSEMDAGLLQSRQEPWCYQHPFEFVPVPPRRPGLPGTMLATK